MTWQPGQSGNAAGRPRDDGAAAQLRKKLAERAEEVVQKVVDAALAGDLGAAKLVLERIVPPLKAAAAPVSFERGATLTATAEGILTAVAAGVMPPDVGAQLLAAVGHVAKAAEVDELARRLAELEARAGSGDLKR